MNNTDIDALSGRELDMAVAVKLGWHKEMTSTSFAEDDGRMPHYSADIAAAWELDGVGWEWNQEEWEGFLYVQAWNGCHTTDHCRYDLEPLGESVVKLSDFPTKAKAYAVARCRAWLKAKYAEKEVLR